ncbi:hypothetical protein ACK2IE_22255 [Clostridioides difficile]
MSVHHNSLVVLLEAHSEALLIADTCTQNENGRVPGFPYFTIVEVDGICAEFLSPVSL